MINTHISCQMPLLEYFRTRFMDRSNDQGCKPRQRARWLLAKLLTGGCISEASDLWRGQAGESKPGPKIRAPSRRAAGVIRGASSTHM